MAGDLPEHPPAQATRWKKLAWGGNSPAVGTGPGTIVRMPGSRHKLYPPSPACIPGKRPWEGRLRAGTRGAWGTPGPLRWYLQELLSPQPVREAPGAQVCQECQWALPHQLDLSPLEIPGVGQENGSFKGSQAAWTGLPMAPPIYALAPHSRASCGSPGPSGLGWLGLALEAPSCGPLSSSPPVITGVHLL